MNKDQIASHIKAWVERHSANEAPNMCSEAAQADLAEYLEENLGPVKVWVLETGAYENKGVEGVYASAEIAMLLHPVTRIFPPGYKPPASGYGDMSSADGWQLYEEDGYWDNGLDWDAGMSLHPFDVIDSSTPSH